MNDDVYGYKDILNIAFNQDGKIKSARIFGYFIGLRETQQWVDAMQNLRALTDSFEVGAYPYSFYFAFYEQYVIINAEAVRTMMLTMGKFIVHRSFLSLVVYATLSFIVEKLYKKYFFENHSHLLLLFISIACIFCIMLFLLGNLTACIITLVILILVEVAFCFLSFCLVVSL